MRSIVLAGLALMLAATPARAQDGWDFAFVPILPETMPVRAQLLEETWEEASLAFMNVEVGVFTLLEMPRIPEVVGRLGVVLGSVQTRIGRAEMGLRATATVRRAEGDDIPYCVEDLLLGDALKKARYAMSGLVSHGERYGGESWDEAAFDNHVAGLRAAFAQYERASAAVAPRRERGWAGDCEIPYGSVTIDGQTLEVR